MVKKIIGFSMRPNLKYPLLYYLYNLVREFESYFIKIFLDYNVNTFDVHR